MKYPQHLQFTRLFLLGILAVGFGASDAWAERPSPDPSAGKAAYQQHCARCHGITADGNGLDAKKLYPKPRRLTEGVYKFRTTASGTPPTDEDLFATLTNGLPGSGMPDWKTLDESVRWQLVYYLKSLSPTFADSQPELVSLGTDPGAKQANLTQGRHMYEKLGCAACHGAEGRANGISSNTLVDNWNRPIRAADLTQGWNYRGGSEPNAIAMRIVTGIDGTPMPSYAEAASMDDIWQLAHYVRSLQREAAWNMIVHATKLDGELPSLPSDSRWPTVERADVRMRNALQPGTGEITGALSIPVVSMQAVYNDTTINLRMSWTDSTESRQPAETDTPVAGPNVGDALAVMFHSADVNGDAVTLHTWPLQNAPSLDLIVWSAQRNQATEAVATNYDELLTGQNSGVTRPSQAVYERGEWTVVVTRPLFATDVTGAMQPQPGRFVPVAFAVWDGGNLGQRAVSSWIDVALGDSSSGAHGHEADAKAPKATSHVRMQVGILAAMVLIVGFVLLTKKP